MPKKTKKQKLLADLRNKIKTVETIQSAKPTENITTIHPQKISKEPVAYVLNDYEKSLSKYVKTDLLKTITIIAILLVLEFLLFFANLNHT